MNLNYSLSNGVYITADALEDLLRDFINTGCPGAIDLALEYLEALDNSTDALKGVSRDHQLRERGDWL